MNVTALRHVGTFSVSSHDPPPPGAHSKYFLFFLAFSCAQKEPFLSCLHAVVIFRDEENQSSHIQFDT